MKSFLLKSLNYPAKTIEWLQALCSALVFILLPLAHLTRIQLSSGGAVYLHEIPLAVSAISFTVSYLWTDRNQLHRLFSRTALPLKLGVVWIVLGMVLAATTNFLVTPWFYFIRLVLYLLFLSAVKTYFTRAVYTLQIWLVVAGIWYWWLAILQYLLIPDLRFLWVFGWDDHYYRMIGSLFDPGLTGSLLVLIGLSIYQLRSQLRWWWLALLVIWGSILLTFSRATYCALLLVIPAIVWAELKPLLLTHTSWRTQLQTIGGWILVGGLVLAVSFAAVPKPGGEGVNLLRTSTIHARLTTATTALQTMQPTDWIFGQGLFTPSTTVQSNSLRIPSKASIPDNIFVTLLTQTGVVGLIVVSASLAIWLQRNWQLYPVGRWGILAMLIASQFNNILLHPYIMLYLGGILICDHLRLTLRSSST